MLLDRWKHTWSDPEGAIYAVRRVLTVYGKQYWRWHTAALMLGAIAGGCTAAAAYLVGNVINQAYVYRSVVGIVSLCAVVIAVFVMRGITLYGQAVMLAYIGNEIAADCQRRMFDKLLREQLGYFGDRHSSEFIARAAFATGAPGSVLTLLINSAGRDLVTLIGLTVVMVVQDPVLSLVCLLVVPPATLSVRSLVRQAREFANTQYLSSAAILEAVQEALQGLRVIKAFNLEEVMRRRAGDRITAVQRASNQMARISNSTGPLMESLGGIAVAIVLAYGGYRVLSATAAPGELFSFLSAFLLAYEPAKRLTHININLNNSLVGVRVLFQVLDTPDTEPIVDGKPPLRLEGGRIEFANVDFAYRPGTPVLRGVSFVAAAGRVTALVGPSGGGKSTILNLILRFYDADSGSVIIDGQDISAVSRRSVRAQIGYVGQDVFLFRGTIRENIAVGKPDADERQIVEAAKAALAHDFIISFPRGYETPVGELGAQLSTGQRQRVAIARSLLKDAKLILLDEPTSALDSESESQVAEAIERLCSGRTILLIAHRLHTVVRANCIYVIENGTVVETGRHDELLRREGRYASLYRLLVQGAMPTQDKDLTATSLE